MRCGGKGHPQRCADNSMTYAISVSSFWLTYGGLIVQYVTLAILRRTPCNPTLSRRNRRRCFARPKLASKSLMAPRNDGVQLVLQLFECNTHVRLQVPPDA